MSCIVPPCGDIIVDVEVRFPGSLLVRHVILFTLSILACLDPYPCKHVRLVWCYVDIKYPAYKDSFYSQNRTSFSCYHAVNPSIRSHSHRCIGDEAVELPLSEAQTKAAAACARRDGLKMIANRFYLRHHVYPSFYDRSYVSHVIFLSAVCSSGSSWSLVSIATCSYRRKFADRTWGVCQIVDDALHPRRADGTCRRCNWPKRVETELEFSRCPFCDASLPAPCETSAVVYDVVGVKVVCVLTHECQRCHIRWKPKTVDGLWLR